MTRPDDLRRFYGLLDDLEQRLGGMWRLKDCDGRMSWPARGVYFFFEDGEERRDSGSGPRVVRVGTHALKPGSRTSLWQRLAQHRGCRQTGSGNHRGSIFRCLLGDSLIQRHETECASWGVGSTLRQAATRLGMGLDELADREGPIELDVSKYIWEMPFLWVTIEDDPGPRSQRGIVERNALALLSNYSGRPIDAPAPVWLGGDSSRERVRRSGLWNNNHVDEEYDPRFLDTLERAVQGTMRP